MREKRQLANGGIMSRGAWIYEPRSLRELDSRRYTIRCANLLVKYILDNDVLILHTL